VLFSTGQQNRFVLRSTVATAAAETRGEIETTMQTSLALMTKRRFLPLFVTQFLNAFNDSIFKMAVVVLATYTIYDDPKVEAFFNQMVQGLFILPFFLLSAVSGQISDSHDKTAVAKMIKNAEIFIMFAGGIGIYFHNIPLMLFAVFAMGVHSTFFGPIKYAILPQHLNDEEVLGGTGLVEAATYVSILLGTVVGGSLSPQWTIIVLMIVAVIGRVSAQFMPPAPPTEAGRLQKIDWNIFRATWRMLRDTLHVRRLFLAIMAISFFWGIGTIFLANFLPIAKSNLGADQTVATAFTALFSVGVAIGSVAINRMLKGKVSARYSPISVIIMGLFVLAFWWEVAHWPHKGDSLMGIKELIQLPEGQRMALELLGISISGGMFVVPLYAFITTTVDKSETSKGIAVVNIMSSAFMVAASAILAILTAAGVSIVDTLLTVAVACLLSAWIAQRLHKACD
jgi:MFS family permease